MLAIRHAGRFLVDLGAFAVRSGRWWIPVLILVLVVATALSSTAHVAVPVVTYTLF
ncbi:hypothetical protein KSP35_06390 [Aquihabitans sp. G128]|uniref:hypothetical protein n=1 Tax=Aquihabitans sp. G128 TaxID=2849779 RepID=UPI001C24D842|nr:hypothetical protein [Aquihabitans sp. G128]QXC62426.1 hypothetical protein KSP35_06390 [Aquihabitans sp. G128]